MIVHGTTRATHTRALAGWPVCPCRNTTRTLTTVLPNGGINPTSKDFQTLRGTKFSWVGFFKNHKTSNESPKSPLFWRNSKKIGKSLNFCSKSGYFCPKNLNFPLKKFVFLKMYIFLPKNFFYKLWKIFQKNITNFFIFEKYSCIKMQ